MKSISKQDNREQELSNPIKFNGSSWLDLQNSHINFAFSFVIFFMARYQLTNTQKDEASCEFVSAIFH